MFVAKMGSRYVVDLDKQDGVEYVTGEERREALKSLNYDEDVVKLYDREGNVIAQDRFYITQAELKVIGDQLNDEGKPLRETPQLMAEYISNTVN